MTSFRGMIETCIQTDCKDDYIKVRDYKMTADEENEKKGEVWDKFAVILRKAKALINDPFATIFGVFVPREQNNKANSLSWRADRWGNTWNGLGPHNFQED
jgi:hypothetical protein